MLDTVRHYSITSYHAVDALDGSVLLTVAGNIDCEVCICGLMSDLPIVA